MGFVPTPNSPSATGVKYLVSALRPLVRQCLSDDSLDLNTDPKVAYKKWIAQEETQTGVQSTLPRDVTREEALKHEPVRTAVDKAVSRLVEIGEAFLDAILANLKNLPFGLRALCSALRDDLTAKFPDAPEAEITKVLGNVLYYRFINPAIIAPEAFGVIEVSSHQEVQCTSGFCVCLCLCVSRPRSHSLLHTHTHTHTHTHSHTHTLSLFSSRALLPLRLRS